MSASLMIGLGCIGLALCLLAAHVESLLRRNRRAPYRLAAEAERRARENSKPLGSVRIR